MLSLTGTINNITTYSIQMGCYAYWVYWLQYVTILTNFIKIFNTIYFEMSQYMHPMVTVMSYWPH